MIRVKKKLKPLLSSILVGFFAFAVIMSMNISTKMVAQEEERIRNQKYADRAADIVTGRADQILGRLRDIGAALQYAQAQSISPTSTFHGFVNDTNFLGELSDLSGVGFFRIVKNAELEQVMLTYDRDRRRRNLGYQPLELKELAEGNLHALVVMIEPLGPGMKEVGTDIMSRGRRDSILRAMWRRAPQASDAFTHFTGETGVALFHPLFKEMNDPVPVGIVATVLRTESFLRSLEDTLAPLELNVEVHDLGYSGEDIADIGVQTLLARGGDLDGLDEGTAGVETDLLITSPAAITRDIDVAGRIWRLAMEPMNVPVSPFAFDRTAGLALLVACLAALLLYRMSQSAENLTEQVALRTARLAEVAETLTEERSQAQYAAHHDELTELLNRRGLRSAFVVRDDDCATQAKNTLLSIDLDRFKQINDTVGHQAGDKLLVAVGQTLTALAPRGALVSRLGGDEFVVVLGDDLDAAECFAEKFLAWTREPIRIDDSVVRFGACVGIASQSLTDCDLDDLHANADIALYAAKDRGRDQYCIFDQEMRSKAVATKSLADDLKRALDEDEFEPFFQTQHEARTHRLAGLETLVRWQHPSKGTLPPAAFLDVAESSGLLHEIDRRTMQKALHEVSRMEDVGIDIPKLSVNIGFDRLNDPSLSQSLTNLPDVRAKLSFEILEAIFLDELDERLIWQLDGLKERGIGIEVDDFGSGRASIIALTRLAPNCLKIDRGLVQPLFASTGQQRLISSIVDMGRALDIAVTAEGVETAEHAEFLKNIGVDTLQGYFFSKPMSASDLIVDLQKRAA